MYGKCFYPTELYEEWHKVFLYAVALQNCEWNIEKIRPLYEDFLKFMEENICDIIPAESLVEKKVYYEALLKTIFEIRKFIKGEDVQVISKDFWLFLNSRYVYLPYIYDLLNVHMQEMCTKKNEFCKGEFDKILKSAEIKDTYQKGIKWEEAAGYFLNHIEGLKISGKRVKTLAQEIDLSIVNVSLDTNLWEMGAYILVECKNWDEKVGIQTIRGLSHISDLKGNKTTFLFVANGLTREAENEIIRSALNGKFILSITKNDLCDLKNEKECYELLITKWRELQRRGELELMV